MGRLIVPVNEDEEFDAAPVETDPNDIDIDTVKNLGNEVVQDYE